MLATLTSFKFIVLYIFIISTLYIHFRGQARYPFFRQLFDHSTFMAPINAFIYLFSKVPNQPYLDQTQFPELKVLQDNWQVIRDEVQALMTDSQIKAADQYNDIGFNSFFRTGWKRFYLKWYDDALPSAQQLCPKTVALLEAIPSVKGAMFALLGKHGRLVRHRDPYAGSVRYHLGIITPNSERCFINVDGQNYAWKDGESVMFDETYLHYAENDTDVDRVILFCDIERPMKNRFATAVNHFFCNTLMAASQSQNLPGDKVGFLNKIFKYVYQIRLVGKKLKAYNKHVYYTVKYSIFGCLFYWIFL
jgi:beta-hydroxylase